MTELSLQEYYALITGEGLLLKSLNQDALMFDGHGHEPEPSIDCVKLIISTNDVDRFKDCLDPRGIELKSFKKNPLFLFEHGKLTAFEKAILGRVNAITVTDNSVIAEAQYVLQEHNKLPEEIWELERKSLMPANSIGWRPLGDIKIDSQGVRHVGRWELIEVSKVLTGVNGNAVNLRYAA